jgi:putative endonuclease
MTTFHVYITTNLARDILYIGVTNNLCQRLIEHYIDSTTSKKHFAGRYNAYWLVYYEPYKYVNSAIRREKEIKGWTRQRKDELITIVNPDWQFYNVELLGEWPPRETDLVKRGAG